jgi:hypothetical protein
MSEQVPENQKEENFIEIRIMSRPGIGRSGLVSALHNVLKRTYKLPVVIEAPMKDAIESIDGFDREEMMRALPDRLSAIRLSSVNLYEKEHQYTSTETIPAELKLKNANDQIGFLRRSLKKILTVLAPEDADNEASLALKHSLGNEFDTYIATPLYPDRPYGNYQKPAESGHLTKDAQIAYLLKSMREISNMSQAEHPYAPGRRAMEAIKRVLGEEGYQTFMHGDGSKGKIIGIETETDVPLNKQMLGSLDEDFKPTHEVIGHEPGAFVFSTGVKLQHIGNGYYKSQYGQRKHVDEKYLRELDPKEV